MPLLAFISFTSNFSAPFFSKKTTGAPRNERPRYLFTKLRPVGNHGLREKSQLPKPVGITPNNFLRNVRLKHAASAASFFISHSPFSRCRRTTSRSGSKDRLPNLTSFRNQRRTLWAES